MTHYTLYKITVVFDYGLTKVWSDYDDEFFTERDIRHKEFFFHGTELAWKRFRQLKTEYKTAEVITLMKKILPDGEYEINMNDDESWISVEEYRPTK